MAIDLSTYHIVKGDTAELVTKLNDALDATQTGVNQGLNDIDVGLAEIDANIANIATVASMEPDINLVVANIVDIQNAQENAAAASASAALAAAIALGVASGRPTIRPTLNLDFVNSDTIDPRITFTRASAGVYYDGKTYATAEENLLTESADFVTSWVAENVAVSANSATAPDGTLTAETITVDAGASSHRIRRSAAVAAAGAVATYSVDFKIGTYGFATLTLAGISSDWVSATINLSTGVITQTGNGAGGTYVTSSVVPSPNGYHRLSVTGSGAGGLTAIWIDISASGTPTQGLWGQHSWTAAGTETVLICWGQLEARAFATAYTPTTTQPITNYIMQLLSAGTDVWRPDYDPVTGVCNGRLVEPAATNLQLYSEDFSNAAWGKGAVTVKSNQIIAPDGTLTGDLVVEDTATSQHWIYQAGSSDIVTPSHSIYVKKHGSRRYVWIGMQEAYGATTTGSNFLFDFDTGTFVEGGSGYYDTPAAKHVGNGWWRISARINTTTSLANRGLAINLAQSFAGRSYTGDGYSGVYIWGAQLEAGPLTSYIKTVASTVTRAADVVTMTGTNFSQWYSPGQGTLVIDATPAVLSAGSGISINDATTSNRIRLAYTSASDQATVTVNGAAQAVLDGGTPVAGTRSILALSYKADDFALSLGGAAAATDTTGTVPVVTQMQIGAETSTAGSLTIRNISFYPLALSDANIQVLSGSGA